MKFQNILKISSRLSLNEPVALILKKLGLQGQPSGSHPTALEEASEVDAKVEAHRRRKEDMEAKAAEERHAKEIAVKEREAEEQARKESTGGQWSSTTHIRADSAGSESTIVDDPVVLDEAYKRYKEKVQSHLSKPELGRKRSHSNKSKIEDYDEEGSVEPVNDSSDVSSTDEEERERRRRREEKRRKAKKAANRKTKSTRPTASSATPSPPSSTSTPHSQHQPPQQPPVSPLPSAIEERLLSYLARLVLNPTTGQPHSLPSSQPSPFTNPEGCAPHQPGQHDSPPAPYPYPLAPYYQTPPMGSHNGLPYYSPPGYFSTPPGFVMYNSGNYTNNSGNSTNNSVSNVGNSNRISNVGNNNSISNVGDNNSISNFDNHKQQESYAKTSAFYS